MGVLPMFPLGSVLVPGMLLPLHVFEPRYRTLMDDVLEGDQRFGVTLIERGSEVGGGDQRAMAGTVARILQAEQSPDGRWGVVALGEERVRVTEWLADDPYPRAAVDPWPEDPTPVDADALARVVALVRRALAIHVELGDLRGDVDVEVVDDPVVASHQLCGASPLGPADRQRLLCAPGPAARIALLEELVSAEIEIATFRLGGGEA